MNRNTDKNAFLGDKIVLYILKRTTGTIENNIGRTNLKITNPFMLDTASITVGNMLILIIASYKDADVGIQCPLFET
jgi:hypothetical protein